MGRKGKILVLIGLAALSYVLYHVSHHSLVPEVQMTLENIEAKDVVHRLDLRVCRSRDEAAEKVNSYLTYHYNNYIVTGVFLNSPIDRFVKIVTGKGKHSPGNIAVVRLDTEIFLAAHCTNFRRTPQERSFIVDTASCKLPITGIERKAETAPPRAPPSRENFKEDFPVL